MIVIASQLLAVLSCVVAQFFASGIVVSHGLALILLPYRLRTVLRSVDEIYELMILVRAILSWVRDKTGFVRDLYRFLDTWVDPFVSIFRRFIPSAGGMDFSAVVAMVVLQVIVGLL